ncbi:unnamed protein product [Auanema sp. JU1783]|nr:unnamed protein product [Auanema sp. JU1783]
MGTATSVFCKNCEENLILTDEVSTENGLVQGFKLNISDERSANVFLSIPYAKPPLDDLRLKNPEPCESWAGVRKCTRFVARAVQTNHYWEDLIINVPKSEDCLYLNVFSPSLKHDAFPNGYPVLVFLHGGGFAHGSSAKFAPTSITKFICRYDVVVVTIEYRLGLLGFFYDGLELLGNYGLWDLTMALKWINKNIDNFSGDSTKVTLFGHGSGAASADLLSISPHSRDLFQQLCLLGGTAENKFSLPHRQRVKDYCRIFAERKGFIKVDDIFNFTDDSLLEFLQNCQAHNFMSEKNLHQMKSDEVGLKIGPVVGFTSEEFLPKPISELRKEAPNRRVIVGASAQEGLLFALFGRTRFNEKGIDKILTRVIPNNVFLEADDIRTMAKELYLKEDEEFSRAEESQAYIELYSDVLINNAIYEFTEKMIMLDNKVYIYSFDYFNPHSLGLMSLRTSIRAATYGAELDFTFGSPTFMNYKFTTEDQQMVDLVTRMWTNFVKFGNPNGPYDDSTIFNFQWEPADSHEPHRFLSISNNCCMKSENHEERGRFWINIRNNKSFM